MDLLTAKNKVMMLIDAYSKNGVIQDPNGTKLKNYTLKMPLFFDMAQKQVATLKKIETILAVATAPATTDDYYDLTLPTNCYQMIGIEYDNYPVPWKRKGKSIALVSNETEFPINLIYYKYPTTITSATLDTYEFEVDTEVQEILPLYVASQLLLSENNAIGDRLFSQYQNMLANIDTTVVMGTNSVINTMWEG